jgi:hypothetical protein
MSSQPLPTLVGSVHGAPSTSGRKVDDVAIPDISRDADRQDDMSNKRKREVEDSGDREQKKTHIEDGRPGIEKLHRDVGRPYLLCKTRKTPLLLYSIGICLQTLLASFYSLSNALG